MKITWLVSIFLIIISWNSLSAQQHVSISNSYKITLDEVPESGKIVVDLSQLDLSNEEMVENVLSMANSRLSTYSDFDFDKKTAILTLNPEFELPDNWTISHWNNYFEQLSKAAKKYIKLRYSEAIKE